MFRFMPLEGANAVLVITRSHYLDQINGGWIASVTPAAALTPCIRPELKYIRAKDLAQRLSGCSAVPVGQGGDNGGAPS